MKTLLQINVAANTTSTGRITEEIGQYAITAGWKSYIAYGRVARPSKSELIRVGGSLNVKIHGIATLLWDLHGFSSTCATKIFIKQIDKINPNVVLFHNLHGYYINVEALFDYLKNKNIPVYWTLHDCWPFTGHCTYFDAVDCSKWIEGCKECNHYEAYPKSLVDKTTRNYKKKKEVFTQLRDLTFVAPSEWIAEIQRHSFMKDYPVCVINNGTNTDMFKPQSKKMVDEVREKFGLGGRRVVLGVASIWDKRKGLDDFKWLSERLPENYTIVLVGLNDEQITKLPKNMVGIKRTEHVEQLATLYALADVFANPTYVDNFPTTNIEALSCGTPVITYHTGGSHEAVDEKTGCVIKKGDRELFLAGIKKIVESSDWDAEECRQRVLKLFNKDDRFEDYIRMFNEKLK